MEIVAIHVAKLKSLYFVFFGVIAAHAVDVARECGIKCSNECTPLGGNELIQHSIVVCVEAFELLDF